MYFIGILGASVYFLNLHLDGANFMLALLGFVIASTGFLGLSLISASLILRFKSRDPVQLVLGNLGSFVAGAYFPVALMPAWLRDVADLIPMTHALNVLRGALLKGSHLQEVSRSLLILLAMAMVTVPTGLLLFSASRSRCAARWILGTVLNS